MTPEQVTPELARELLDEAYPEPRFVDEWTAEEVDLRPVTVTAELVPLVEAAPALAELVANMRYEYAVRAPSGEWVRETDEGELALTISHMRALRHYHPLSIEQLCELASDQFNCECRVVRRLVTDWVVAE